MKCKECGKKVDATQIDEFEKPKIKKGINIPVNNIPEYTEEMHFYRNCFGNLCIHYKKSD